jgi:hypothetical protein
MGTFEAEGDASDPAGIVYSIMQPPVLVNADFVLLPYHVQGINPPSAYAAEEILNDGAASNVKLAIQITTVGATELKVARLRLRQLGTPAYAPGAHGLQLHIETNAAGDPSGVTVGAPSRYVDTATFPLTNVAGGEWVDFYFNAPVSLSAATIYHLVLTTDYTASLINAVAWQAATVLLAAQRSKFFDAAWAAVSLKNFVFQALAAKESELLIGGLSWDLGNGVSLRPNVNDSQGFQGGWIGSRLAVGKAEPEEELAANRDFLAELDDQTELCMLHRLGEDPGNRIYIQMPFTQTVGANSWGNREGIMTRPLDLQFNQSNGGDDIIIISR